MHTYLLADFPVDRLDGYAPYHTGEILTFVSDRGDTTRYSVYSHEAGVQYYEPGCKCGGQEVATLYLELNYEPRDPSLSGDCDFYVHINIPDRKEIDISAGIWHTTVRYSKNIELKKVSDLEPSLIDTLRIEGDNGHYLTLVNGKGLIEYTDDTGHWKVIPTP